MTRIKYLAGTLVAAILVSCSGPAEDTSIASKTPVPVTSALAEDTRLAAVLVYADWCGSCKILDPKLETAKAEGPIDGIQYVVLDYTERDDAAFFSAADALGIGAPVRAKLDGSIKTGILLLVDIDDAKIVGDLRKELSPADIRAAMVEAAASA